MMGQVLQLDRFRNGRRKDYFKKFGRHLDKVIISVLEKIPSEDLSQLARQYQDYCALQNELAWDYAEFRDILYSIVSDNLSEIILSEARDLYWFDALYVSKEYVTERTLSFIVLGESAFVAEK